MKRAFSDALALASPSGRISKHSLKRAQERIRQELFGLGLNYPAVAQASERVKLLSQAAELRALANRGMKPRAYLAKAKELEDKANTMKNPLAHGYSRETIQRNIRKLRAEGFPEDRAVAVAFREARKWFEQYNPGASLLAYLRPTKNPLTKREKRLFVNQQTRELNKKRLASLPKKRSFLTGSVIGPHGSSSLIGQGKRLYSGFMQRPPSRSQKITLPPPPKVALAIGKVSRLYYVSNRGGRATEYRHDFATGSRPLLAVSHDGKTLMLLGGAYRFTDRGIVDK